MRQLRSLLFLPVLWLATGCDNTPEPAPSLDNADVQAAIEQEDAAIHERESQL